MSASLPLYPPRPRTRGDCLDDAGPHGERPCIRASCRHHLLFARSDGAAGNHPDRLVALARATDEEAADMIEALSEEATRLVWSCTLDVADQGGSSGGDVTDRSEANDEEAEDEPAVDRGRSDHTLSDIAEALGISRERVRQLESTAMRKFKRNAERMGLAHLAGGLGRWREVW